MELIEIYHDSRFIFHLDAHTWYPTSIKLCTFFQCRITITKLIIHIFLSILDLHVYFIVKLLCLHLFYFFFHFYFENEIFSVVKQG